MTKFVVDAYAWIEYLEGSEKGKAVTEIVEDGSNELFTPSTTIAEVVSKFLKIDKDVKIAVTAMDTLSSIIIVNQDISILASHIHFETKKKNKNFGMLDAFVAAAAKSINAKILTGDNDFKNFKEAVII